ncbi:MAG: SDR family oxidoreductase [Bacteroidia bacterium]|nr:SDR family oxidoreductase [Bacteroidia bacterium]
MSRFSQEPVLITGAAAGIGRAAAFLLARAGAHVIVSDVQEAAGEDTAAQIRAAGGQAEFIRAEVADEASVQALFREIETRYGRLSGAVNNAGIEGPWGQLVAYPTDAWHRVLAVNLTGVFFCMREELRLMSAAGTGAIVNIASVAGVSGFPRHPAYAASKHGVLGLTRTAALEHARQGIRINAVCPAFTRTDMVGQNLTENPDLEPKLIQAIPLRRLGTAEEIAEAIVWLLSPEASFITGHALLADGGMRA